MTANRWASMCADRILANSKGVAEYLALNERVRQDKIVEIPNFLDADAFVLADESARLAQRRAWGVPDGAFVIGIVARLSPVKNHSLLISAAAHLERRIHLVLVGDGPSRAALEKLAQQMGLADRVHFAGEVVSRENLHQYFDVSVLCSTSEGFPNSVLEAMAAARPVIATPVGGVTEAITDGSTGILVSVNDLEGLVHALRRLQSDTHLRAKLGDAAREFVRIKYHRSTVIEALSSLYERLAYRTSFQSSGAA
jgi:glycosyltransferase involved in cell wall biosynthesis